MANPKQYQYMVFVYKVSSRKIGQFDVEAFVGPAKATLTDAAGQPRACVSVTRVNSGKHVSLERLTAYFRWKFNPCQRGTRHALRANGKFTHIDANQDWIQSIVDTELDYHVGDRWCMRDADQRRLRVYSSECRASFGPPLRPTR